MKHARQKWLSLNFTRLKALISCLVNGLHPSLYKWFQVLNRLESIGKPFATCRCSWAPSRAGQGEENILRTFAGCTVLQKFNTSASTGKVSIFMALGLPQKHPFYSLQPHHSHLKVEAPIAVQATKETRAAKAFPPRGYHDALSWGNQKCPHWLRMSIDVHCFCWFQPIYLYLIYYMPKKSYIFDSDIQRPYNSKNLHIPGQKNDISRWGCTETAIPMGNICKREWINYV
jgi:hypothetical protein